MTRGFASSHAFTFVSPEGWEPFRTANLLSFERRYGVPARTAPDVHAETLQQASRRYDNVVRGLDRVRAEIRAGRLDALVIVGDDQNENFDGTALPQIAIYTGEEITVSERFMAGEPTWPTAGALARDILVEAVEAEFDVTGVLGFREGTLRSHAHGEIIANLLGDVQIPVVLVFLNAVHVPALAPSRCYRLGETIARAVRNRRPAAERVGVFASGGLSHFTAGYPWPAYEGPAVHGSICTDFDRRSLEWLASGSAANLAALTSTDLLDTGNIELRSWICAAGAMGATTRWSSVYEPIPRAIMGMAVAWTGAE